MRDTISVGVTTCDNRNLPSVLCNVKAKFAHHLRQTRIIVVDDSRDKAVKYENQSICDEYSSGQASISYCDNSVLRELIQESDLDTSDDLFKLGSGNSNAYTARNLVGLLSPTKNCIVMDDDLYFPMTQELSDSQLNQVRSFACFKLLGIPDFSSLMWIEAFMIFASLATRTVITPKPTHLITRLVPQISEILHKFPTPGSESISTQELEKIKPHVLGFFHPGATITRPQIIRDIPFPQWYNEDWTWEIMVARKYGEGQIFSEFVVQRGCEGRKSVVSDRVLAYEEFGKVVNLAIFQNETMRESEKTTSIRKAIKNRSRYISRLLKMNSQLAHSIESQGRLRSHDRCEIESNLKQIRHSLDHLMDYVSSIEVHHIRDAIASYRSYRTIWRQLAAAGHRSL